MPTDGLYFSCRIGDLPADTFDVVEFTLHEGLSALFTLSIKVVSRQPDIDAEEQLLKRATLTDHPNTKMNDRWQVVTARHHGKQPAAPEEENDQTGTTLTNEITFIPGKTDWRPPYHTSHWQTVTSWQPWWDQPTRKSTSIRTVLSGCIDRHQHRYTEPRHPGCRQTAGAA